MFIELYSESHKVIMIIVWDAEYGTITADDKNDCFSMTIQILLRVSKYANMGIINIKRESIMTKDLQTLNAAESPSYSMFTPPPENQV